MGVRDAEACLKNIWWKDHKNIHRIGRMSALPKPTPATTPIGCWKSKKPFSSSINRSGWIDEENSLCPVNLWGIRNRICKDKITNNKENGM